MNSPDKLLTVIVPSYNMEEYLPKCLGSLVVPDESLFQRLDVIVVNDGSKDRTSEIAHQFECDYPGVFRVIDKDNGNYGSCINAALPKASGTFVKILDADDHFDSQGGFAKFLEKLAAGDNSADLILTDYLCIDVSGNIIKHGKFNLPKGRIFPLPDSAQTYIQFGLHSVTYRTSVVKSVGYTQTEGISYTDLEWVIEPMIAVKRVSYFPIIVYHRLIGRAGQTTESYAKIASRYSDICRIAINISSRYSMLVHHSASAESLKYFQGKICQLLSSIFVTAVSGYHGHRVMVNIRELNRQLEAEPDLFKLTEQARLWSRCFPIRIIWCWRRNPGIGTPLLLVFRFVQFLKNVHERLFQKGQSR